MDKGPDRRGQRQPDRRAARLDAAALLREMLADMGPATRALLEGQAPTVIAVTSAPPEDDATR